MRDVLRIGAALAFLVLVPDGPAEAQEPRDSAAAEALRMEITGRVRVPQLLTIQPREGWGATLSLLEAAERLDPGLLGVPRSLEPGFVPVVDPKEYRHLLREVRRGTSDTDTNEHEPVLPDDGRTKPAPSTDGRSGNHD